VDSGGRHGAAFGRLDSTRTPGLHKWLARGVPSCARGCRLLYLLSAEGDNNRFPYKEDAHVEGGIEPTHDLRAKMCPPRSGSLPIRGRQF
jgi:hypothetical protein